MLSPSSLLCALSLSLPGTAQDEVPGWGQWLGGATRQNSVELAASQGVSQMEEAWRRPLGSGYSSVAVEGGQLACMMSEGTDDFVCMLDAATGEEQWRFAIGETYRGHDGSIDGPLSTPALDEQAVYALGPRGRLACLARKDGALRWQVELSSELDAREPHYGFATSPLLAGELVILQAGGAHGPEGKGSSLLALKRSDGSLVWRAESDTSGYNSPALATLDGIEQVIVHGDQRVYSVGLTDGELLWEYAFRENSSWTPMVLPGGRVFVATGDKGLMLGIERKAAGSWQVELLWKNKLLTDVINPIALVGDVLYGIDRRQLTAVSATTGALLWRYERDAFPIGLGNSLACLADREGLLLLGRPSAEGFEASVELRLYENEGNLRVESPMAYANGLLFVRTDFALIAVRVD